MGLLQYRKDKVWEKQQQENQRQEKLKQEKQRQEKLKLKSGSSEPGRNIVKSITKKQLEEIAKEKMVDLNAFTVNSAMKMVAGTARSMGIKVNREQPPVSK